MTGAIAIRRLGLADLASLRKLNSLFGEVFDDRDTYDGEPPGDCYCRELLSRDHIRVLVALDGDEVVGGLVAYELAKLERARSEFYIYDLAVKETYRRRGIATALIARLREIAARCGAWVIYVQADYADPPAIALYEKLGVREEVLHFDIAVRSSR